MDLLSTGVDVPIVNNIVFFRYLRSRIAFHQMVGRGTRLHPQTNKLMFRVYDYTDATRLFGEEFRSLPGPEKPAGEEEGNGNDEDDNGKARTGTRAIVVQGIDVRITEAGTYIMATSDDGQTTPVTLEEYKQRLAAKLVEDIPVLDEFRTTWADRTRGQEMMVRMPDGGRSPLIVRHLAYAEDHDLYDVLADVGLRTGPQG